MPEFRPWMNDDDARVQPLGASDVRRDGDRVLPLPPRPTLLFCRNPELNSFLSQESEENLLFAYRPWPASREREPLPLVSTLEVRRPEHSAFAVLLSWLVKFSQSKLPYSPSTFLKWSCFEPFHTHSFRQVNMCTSIKCV